MQGDIDRVLVICPAGLKENWRRHMGMARISSIEFSYSTFSLNDPKKFSGLRQLEYELRATNDKTLVLIDESHHFAIRNMPRIVRSSDTNERRRRLSTCAARMHYYVQQRRSVVEFRMLMLNWRYFRRQNMLPKD